MPNNPYQSPATVSNDSSVLENGPQVVGFFHRPIAWYFGGLLLLIVAGCAVGKRTLIGNELGILFMCAYDSAHIAISCLCGFHLGLRRVRSVRSRWLTICFAVVFVFVANMVFDTDWRYFSFHDVASAALKPLAMITCAFVSAKIYCWVSNWLLAKAFFEYRTKLFGLDVQPVRLIRFVSLFIIFWTIMPIIHSLLPAPAEIYGISVAAVCLAMVWMAITDSLSSRMVVVTVFTLLASMHLLEWVWQIVIIPAVTTSVIGIAYLLTRAEGHQILHETDELGVR